MRKLSRSALIAALLMAAPAFATDYTVDQAHTSVGFTIRHMVSKVNGAFKDFDGKFSFDEKNPAKSNAEFTIKTASIDTANTKRDEHLRSPDFFDATKYPTITFKSTKVAPAGKNKFKLEGELNMHGVTKPVTLMVEFGGTAKDPWGNEKAGFNLTGKLNRKDYGISWNKTLDSGSIMLGDDVMLNIDVEAQAAAAAAAPKKS